MESDSKANTVASPILPRNWDDNVEQSGTLMEFDRMAIDLPWNTHANREEQPLAVMNVPMHSSAGPETSVKEMKVKIKQTPIFLSKHHVSCRQLLSDLRSFVKMGSDADAWTEIAILIHRIMVIQTYQRLWTTHLRSDIEPVPSLRFKQATKRARELERLLKRSQTELNRKVNQRADYSLAVQEHIERFLEQHLRPWRANIEHQIDLVHYDCCVRALKQEFRRQQPTGHQVSVFSI